MKNCPFCKNEIPKHSEKCPDCQQTLIEKIPQKEWAPLHSARTTPQNYTPKTSNIKKFVKNLRLVPLKFVVFPVIVLLLIIIGVSLGQTDTPMPPNPIPQTTYTKYEHQTADFSDIINSKPMKYAVLTTVIPNGTIIKSRSAYLQGEGEILIKNGTNQDAVAKLIIGKTSIYSVYITAHSNYTIKNISDGYYNLVFALGNGWDATNKVFVDNNSYEKFDEGFNFTTYKTYTGDYVDTHYKTFSITLNPIIGGTAKTEQIDSALFDSY